MPPIQSPIRLAGNPPEVIDSTEAAARFMDALDIEAANLLRLLRDANTAESADEAILAFRDWVDGLGLLDEPIVDANL
jgi:hypothetical protein